MTRPTPIHMTPLDGYVSHACGSRDVTVDEVRQEGKPWRRFVECKGCGDRTVYVARGKRWVREVRAS